MNFFQLMINLKINV